MSSKEAHPTLKSLLEVSLQSIQREGWGSFSLEMLARESGYPLESVLSFFPHKNEVVKSLFREIQEHYEDSLSTLVWSSHDSVKDQLFDCFMARFDILEPYKDVLKQFWSSVLKDPWLGLVHERMSEKFLSRLLEKVALRPSLMGGFLNLKAFYLLYLWTFKTWISEEKGFQEETMSALDQGLTQLQKGGLF